MEISYKNINTNTRWHPSATIIDGNGDKRFYIKEVETGCGLGYIYGWCHCGWSSETILEASILQVQRDILNKKVLTYKNGFGQPMDYGSIFITSGDNHVKGQKIRIFQKCGFKKVKTYHNLRHADNYSQTMFMWSVASTQGQRDKELKIINDKLSKMLNTEKKDTETSSQSSDPIPRARITINGAEDW